MMEDEIELTPDLLLQGYRSGVFPMSETRDSEDVFWVDPRFRGILPLDGFHISRSLRKRLMRTEYTISFNTCFQDVVRGCADREETWINDTIYDLYAALFNQGDAASCEVWLDTTLVGGVYGVTIGGAFFGESMFSTATDASKVALSYLTYRLRADGFTLFDTQFITDHLGTLGGIEIKREAYHALLRDALQVAAQFTSNAAIPTPQDLIQRNTQTS
ncbi:leucyl/phenylalanyl-tRNA--protein transferase [Yoonia sp.]|uniref:leucyl/phenylalanyl-tRNA--protein transferase n=1 Tax=Yoonia sp. TaxID=2212373 RepID=UPI00238F5CC9|nr:leucyl/phenylalanyl-tRNA--protein transferase [Yoonia sp.]MDE0851949.1 leucyl/phenylalanyl-tRNA--protein transferase [Yoonia sp.]